MTESYTPHPKEASTPVEISRLSESQNFYEQPPFIDTFALALLNAAIPIESSDLACLITKFVAKRETLRQQQGGNVSMNGFLQDVVNQLPVGRRPFYQDSGVILSRFFKQQLQILIIAILIGIHMFIRSKTKVSIRLMVHGLDTHFFLLHSPVLM